MASGSFSTPYTPIFPPPLPKKHILKTSCTDDDSSSACHQSSSSDPQNDNNNIPYIQKLKQRYLRLASVPYELCAPSREITPEAQTRIDSIRSRIRSRREMRLPLELALTCVGVAGGDWVGEPLSDFNDGDEYILPRSEAEWFQWERRRKVLREKRKAERQAEERRNDIAKWTEGIQVDNNTLLQEIPLFIQPDAQSLPESIPVPIIEPSLPPPAPVLEPLHDFNDSISGNSAPSLPFSITAFVDTVRRITAPSLPTAPVLIPPSPPPPIPPYLTRPVVIEQPKETFLPRDNQLCSSNPQLSSPISPPRSLRPLSGTQGGSFPVSSKRLHQDEDENDVDSRSINSRDILDTPRPNKRFKPGDQPITPKSVERPSLPSSQQLQEESQAIDDIRRLPTLMELIASSSGKGSRRGTPGQRSGRGSHTPHQGALGLPELPPSSQLSFSMFMPQAESTQVHDLPT